MVFLLQMQSFEGTLLSQATTASEHPSRPQGANTHPRPCVSVPGIYATIEPNGEIKVKFTDDSTALHISPTTSGNTALLYHVPGHTEMYR